MLWPQPEQRVAAVRGQPGQPGAVARLIRHRAAPLARRALRCCQGAHLHGGLHGEQPCRVLLHARAILVACMPVLSEVRNACRQRHQEGMARCGRGS